MYEHELIVRDWYGHEVALGVLNGRVAIDTEAAHGLILADPWDEEFWAKLAQTREHAKAAGAKPGEPVG
jgi:hypothetical protein